MKTLCKYTIVVLLMSNTFAIAQIGKGNVLVVGTVSFSSTNTGSANTSTFSVDPSISYFFGKKFTMGIVYIVDNYQSTIGTFKETKNSYSIGPTFRYYFPLGENWAIFPQVDYTYGTGTKRDERTAPVVTTADVGPTFRSGMGINYFITSHVGVEGLLYYQVVGHSTNNTVYNTGSVGIRFGLQVYLSKKKKDN